MNVGSRIKQLDLHVMSNYSTDRAEMVVSECMESETEDFAESHPILDHGSVIYNISVLFEQDRYWMKCAERHFPVSMASCFEAHHSHTKVLLPNPFLDVCHPATHWRLSQKSLIPKFTI